MKKLFALIMSVLALNSISYAAECHSSPCKKQHRVYVQAENIQVTENGIFFILDGQTIPVKALRTDEGGLYVTGLQTKGKTVMYGFICRGCNRAFYSRFKNTLLCLDCRKRMN